MAAGLVMAVTLQFAALIGISPYARRRARKYRVMSAPGRGSIGARHQTLRQAVTDQIQTMIRNGDLVPGERLLERLYTGRKARGTPPAVPSFTPAAAAALQVSLALKVLLKRPLPAPGTLYLLDLDTLEMAQIVV